MSVKKWLIVALAAGLGVLEVAGPQPVGRLLAAVVRQVAGLQPVGLPPVVSPPVEPLTQ